MWPVESHHVGHLCSVGGQGGMGMGHMYVDGLCGLVASSRLVESVCSALILFLP